MQFKDCDRRTCYDRLLINISKRSPSIILVSIIQKEPEGKSDYERNVIHVSCSFDKDILPMTEWQNARHAQATIRNAELAISFEFRESKFFEEKKKKNNNNAADDTRFFCGGFFGISRERLLGRNARKGAGDGGDDGRGERGGRKGEAYGFDQPVESPRARGDNLRGLMTNRVPVLPGQELVSPTARREYLPSACFGKRRSFYHLLPAVRSRDIPCYFVSVSRNVPRRYRAPDETTKDIGSAALPPIIRTRVV